MSARSPARQGDASRRRTCWMVSRLSYAYCAPFCTVSLFSYAYSAPCLMVSLFSYAKLPAVLAADATASRFSHAALAPAPTTLVQSLSPPKNDIVAGGPEDDSHAISAAFPPSVNPNSPCERTIRQFASLAALSIQPCRRQRIPLARAHIRLCRFSNSPFAASTRTSGRTTFETSLLPP